MAQWVLNREASTLFGAMTQQTTVEALLATVDAPTVVIVPTATQRPHFLRAWLREYPQKPAPMIMTMAQFVRRLGEQVMPQGPRLLSESSVDLLIRHATKDDSALRSLGFSSQKLVRWLQHDRTPADVEDLAEGFGTATRKGRLFLALASSMRRLEELYADRGVDRGTYVQLLIQKLRADDHFRFLQADGATLERILVVDTHGITPVDARLLLRLSEMGWDIGIRFCEEPACEGEALPRSTTSTDVMQFVTHGWVNGASSTIRAPEHLHCLRAASPVEEVRAALSRVHAHVQQGGTLDDIVICLPASQRYRRILQQEAPSMGVPLKMANPQPLIATRIATAVWSACQLIMSRAKRFDLERLLTDPLLADDVRGGGHVLIEIAYRDRLRGGTGMESWQEHLQWTLSEIDKAEQRSQQSMIDESWARDRRRDAYVLASTVVARLMETLSIDPDARITGAAFAETVASSIIKGLGFETSLLSALENELRSPHVRDLSVEPLALERLRDLLVAYAGLSQRHDLPVAVFADHVMAFWFMVEQSSIDPRNAPNGVEVASPAELRGRHFAHVIALGLVEGEFPRSQEQLFDDELVPLTQRRLEVEAMADLLGVAAGGQLTLLRPQQIDDSKTILSSFIRGFSLPADEQPVSVQSPARRRQRETTGAPYRRTQVALLNRDLAPSVVARYEMERDRPLSPSRLDDAGACPFRYMARRVFRVDAKASSDAALTPLERGNLMHELVLTFYRRLQGDALQPIHHVTDLLERRVLLTSSHLEDYWLRMTDIVEEYATRQAWSFTFVEAERRALLGSKSIPGLLRRWLEREIRYQHESGHAPALFEHEVNVEMILGVDGRDAADRSVRVQARIDRIDVAPSEYGITFIVNDYKPDISDGYSFGGVLRGVYSQMPVYVKAVALDFQKYGGQATPLAAVYRSFGKSLRDDKNPRNSAVLFDPALAHWGKRDITSVSLSQVPSGYKEFVARPLMGQVDEILEQYVLPKSIIDEGRFAVEPRKGVCDYCSYTELCRKDEWGTVGGEVSITVEGESEE